MKTLHWLILSGFHVFTRKKERSKDDDDDDSSAPFEVQFDICNVGRSWSWKAGELKRCIYIQWSQLEIGSTSTSRFELLYIHYSRIKNDLSLLTRASIFTRFYTSQLSICSGKKPLRSSVVFFFGDDVASFENVADVLQQWQKKERRFHFGWLKLDACCVIARETDTTKNVVSKKDFLSKKRPETKLQALSTFSPSSHFAKKISFFIALVRYTVEAAYNVIG